MMTAERSCASLRIALGSALDTSDSQVYACARRTRNGCMGNEAPLSMYEGLLAPLPDWTYASFAFQPGQHITFAYVFQGQRFDTSRSLLVLLLAASFLRGLLKPVVIVA